MNFYDMQTPLPRKQVYNITRPGADPQLEKFGSGYLKRPLIKAETRFYLVTKKHNTIVYYLFNFIHYSHWKN
jgi:hypothetical protein